jgi:hypothetical protein
VTGLSPADAAAHDQALAWVRDLAATGMPVLFIDIAQGQTCCWCSCPNVADDNHICAGCPAPADAVLRVYPEPEIGDHWPVCRAHRDDALRVAEIFIASTAQSP